MKKYLMELTLQVEYNCMCKSHVQRSHDISHVSEVCELARTIYIYKQAEF